MSPIIDAEKIKRAFKAYDVRGRVPEDLDEDLAFAIGQSYAAFVKPKKVAVGCDIRLSSPAIKQALMQGLTQAGVNVVDIGVCGTEQVYFTTFFYKLDGGIMVTASHNPKDYNGMKMVREQGKPISEDTGLKQIAQLILAGDHAAKKFFKGKIEEKKILPDYTGEVLKFIDPKEIRPYKVVFNSGNGAAGATLDSILPHLPISPIRLLHEPDGTFPNGVPNPMLEESRKLTSETVRREKADLGIAWDGDFDRCFFFDEQGEFVDGYYLVGLLASHILKKFPGERVVHDPRLLWNTVEVVYANGGIPVMHKSGHAFMKQRMREENAVFGGETSAHYYFRDFGYCDSGMAPWMLILELMSQSGKKLSELVSERQKMYPVSGELNRKVSHPLEIIARTKAAYSGNALVVDETDGLSLDFEKWRFNLRPSNTEPLIRLNVETRGDPKLLQEKTTELLDRLEG